MYTSSMKCNQTTLHLPTPLFSPRVSLTDLVHKIPIDHNSWFRKKAQNNKSIPL